MPIPRFHLFELEDQPWFPAVVRDLATDYLHFIEKFFSLHRPVVPLLSQALRQSKSTAVIDLCSGGSGPVPQLQKALAAEGLAIHFTLTDRYPNVLAFQRAAVESGGGISFVAEPVDATKVPAALRGFRTMFNSFHHFSPPEAMAVLLDAAQAGQPIGIFEIPDRTVRTLVSLLLLTPLLVVVTTPFIRPFRWRRFLWTYLVPLVPLTCWWDGIVSQLRAYSPAELEGLAKGLGIEGYLWRAGQVPILSTPGKLTYLIGHPDRAV